MSNIKCQQLKKEIISHFVSLEPSILVSKNMRIMKPIMILLLFVSVFVVILSSLNNTNKIFVLITVMLRDIFAIWIRFSTHTYMSTTFLNYQCWKESTFHRYFKTKDHTNTNGIQDLQTRLYKSFENKTFYYYFNVYTPRWQRFRFKHRIPAKQEYSHIPVIVMGFFALQIQYLLLLSDIKQGYELLLFIFSDGGISWTQSSCLKTKTYW